MGFLSGIGQAIGGAINAFGGHHNPARDANKYLDQIPGAMGEYYNPYINMGREVMGDYRDQINDLLGGNVYDRLGAGYKESPGYQHALQQALQAGTHASAAGGMLGTPQSAQQNMQLAGDVASRDFENYMRNQMGLYGMGFQGMGGLNQMGFDASRGYGDALGNILGQQAQYAYAGAAGRNRGRAQGISDIFGGITDMFGKKDEGK